MAAILKSVDPSSPAWEAGLRKGFLIAEVEGFPLRDIIDWRWRSCDDTVSLTYLDGRDNLHKAELHRRYGQDWGLEFQDALFDGTMQCRNACTFCFMRQLPEDARSSLTLRDDDYRLSFLQGTFVTFTNVGPEDEARIVEQHISPLRFSLHASSPNVRLGLIGKHAMHGFAVAQRLLEAGIELHTQIVLVPGVNDGEELVRTLKWAYERPGILNVGIVPMGYTKYQSEFEDSFSKESAARAVLDSIAPFQEKAQLERGHAWVHAADEFYCKAYPSNLLDKLPPASAYGSFDLFDDGIGIIRSYVDDFYHTADLLENCVQALEKAHTKVLLVSGFAQQPFLSPLLERYGAQHAIVPLYVENHYFGGNVDVTGLLCACDIVPTINAFVSDLDRSDGAYIAFIPSVVFNADGLTLDDVSLEQIQAKSTCPVFMVSCQASDYIPEIMSILEMGL